jgi:hypothetical protein
MIPEAEREDDDFLAFFSLRGELVDDGYLDARTSAEALLGVNEVFQFFFAKTSPQLAQVKIDVPIRVRKGSWEALIPADIEPWVKNALIVAGVAGGLYVAPALKKMAENDVGTRGFKDVLKGVVKSIKWVIKIAEHLGTMAKRKFDEAKIQEQDGLIFVGIQNGMGEWLYVPKRYLDLFQECPEQLFARLALVIQEKRELTIGFNDRMPVDKDDAPGSVTITYEQKFVFGRFEDEDVVLFPHLVHDQYVELEGHVTRGNESSNTIGFQFDGHILTCYPAQGNIKRYKGLLFTNSTIKGFIDRTTEDGAINSKRPQIRFVDLIEVPSDTPPDLFSDPDEPIR